MINLIPSQLNYHRCDSCIVYMENIDERIIWMF